MTNCERDALPTELIPHATEAQQVTAGSRSSNKSFVMIRSQVQQFPFKKIVEALYRMSSGRYYALVKIRGKQIKQFLKIETCGRTAERSGGELTIDTGTPWTLFVVQFFESRHAPTRMAPRKKVPRLEAGENRQTGVKPVR